MASGAIAIRDRFAGTTEDVLKRVARVNLVNITSETRGNIDRTIRELLQTIPLKTLAVFAHENRQLAALYLPFMSDSQLAVSVPQIRHDEFVAFLNKQFSNEQLQWLPFATSSQKTGYIDQDYIKFPNIQKWTTIKFAIFEKISDFKQNPTEEKYRILEQTLRDFSASANIEIQQGKLILDRLKKMIKQGQDQGFWNYIEEKEKQIENFNEDFKKAIELKNSLAEKLSETVEIPEEFKDPLTDFPMDEPWTDGINTLDKTTWDRSDQNPYTRGPKKIFPHLELKAQIEAFKTKYPELWKKG